jgi:hypothetical protein
MTVFSSLFILVQIAGAICSLCRQQVLDILDSWPAHLSQFRREFGDLSTGDVMIEKRRKRKRYPPNDGAQL